LFFFVWGEVFVSACEPSGSSGPASHADPTLLPKTQTKVAVAAPAAVAVLTAAAATASTATTAAAAATVSETVETGYARHLHDPLFHG
jgi:hypothetical protein